MQGRLQVKQKIKRAFVKVQVRNISMLSVASKTTVVQYMHKKMHMLYYTVQCLV